MVYLGAMTRYTIYIKGEHLPLHPALVRRQSKDPGTHHRLRKRGKHKCTPPDENVITRGLFKLTVGLAERLEQQIPFNSNGRHAELIAF